MLVPNQDGENKISQQRNFAEEFQKQKEIYDQQKAQNNFSSTNIKALNQSNIGSTYQIVSAIPSIGDIPHNLDKLQVQKQNQNFPHLRKSGNLNQNSNTLINHPQKTTKNIDNYYESNQQIPHSNINNTNNTDITEISQVSPKKPQSSQTIYHKIEFGGIQHVNNIDIYSNFINFCFPDFSVMCDYSSGDSFGDVALLTRSKQQLFCRIGTVVCKEDTHIISLSKESFDKILGEQQKIIIKNKISYLKSFPFFHSFPDAIIMNIINCMKYTVFKKNDVIYCEGDESNFIYFIINGEVELSQREEIQDSSKEEQIFLELEQTMKNYKFSSLNHVKEERKKQRAQKRVKFALLGNNNCFGEKEIVQNSTRTQMAICSSQSADIYLFKKEMFMNYLKAYDSIKKFEEFYHQKQNERQKRIDQVIKIKNKIIQTQQKEQQKLNFKAYSLKSMNPSINDLISPKGSTHDISQFDGYQTINGSMFNTFRNKLQALESSPKSHHQDELEHRAPYMYESYVNQNTQQSPRTRPNLSLNNEFLQQTLKELTKQKVYDDIVLVSKKKRKVFKQLKNVQNSHSIELSQAQFEDQSNKNNKNQLKPQKLDVLFDYFFEETPLLHKLYANKEQRKRKPFLSQSNDFNNRITNQIIEAISHREQDEDALKIKSQQSENINNSELIKQEYSRRERVPSIISKVQAQTQTTNQTQTTTQTQPNENLIMFARKEYIPQFQQKEDDDNKLKITIPENESPTQNDLPKILVPHLFKNQIINNNITNVNNSNTINSLSKNNSNIANNNISQLTNNNNTNISHCNNTQLTYISNTINTNNSNIIVSLTQRNLNSSRSKEKNIHVENLKSNYKKKSISQKSLHLTNTKDLNIPTEQISQDNQISSTVSVFSNFLAKQQQFISPRNRIGLVKKSLPSLYQQPIPQTKTQAQISDFCFPSSIQSPISNNQTSHSLKPFSIVNKINKKQ